MTTSITPNKHYSLMAPQLSEIRLAVKGAFFVKQEGASLLPHPSAVDTTSDLQKMRYKQYLSGAEFPEYTKTTLKAMISKMKLQDTFIELDSRLEYLIEDCDGDGTSLKGLAESCVNNILPVGWHFLLSDYQGLSSVGLDEVSIEDVEKANPRATIKQYSRENVLQWFFARKHGRMQLTYVLLRECGTEVDGDSFSEIDVTSYLRLGVDEQGYYQQKITYGEGGVKEGDRNYVSVNNAPLQFIPYEIVSDAELTPGEFPIDTGYLTSIVDQSYFRYRVSASYKEALANLLPTLNVYGVTPQDWEDFKTTNARDYMASGSMTPNIFSNENTKVELLETNMSLQQFKEYFFDNTAMVRANGGIFNSDATNDRTATEVINEAEISVSVLTPIANSTQSGIERSILYCGMFEGIYQVENLESSLDDVVVNLPREFAARKLTVEEAKEYRENYALGVLSLDTYKKVMAAGGWPIEDDE